MMDFKAQDAAASTSASADLDLSVQVLTHCCTAVTCLSAVLQDLSAVVLGLNAIVQGLSAIVQILSAIVQGIHAARISLTRCNTVALRTDACMLFPLAYMLQGPLWSGKHGLHALECSFEWSVPQPPLVCHAF